ncbi:MAG: hypothetical protein JJT94_15655 [Bernardetiaceae bacterium]|nr:hypothetical protein [Bernardetiaceae bacterium]
MELRYLRVGFDLPLHFEQVSAFRGAVATKVGEAHVAFHHHFLDKETGESKLLYRYPRIQYKRLFGKAAMVCLGDAVDEIHHLFEKSDWRILLHNKEIDLRIEKLDMQKYELNVCEELRTYSINYWLALNSENYQKYQNAKGLGERISILECILKGNILSMASGLDWHIENKFELFIEEIESSYVVPYKTTPLSAFSIRFQTNLFLPNYIGIGKGASRGFGTVRFKAPEKRERRVR